MKPKTVDEYVMTLDEPMAGIVNVIRQIVRQAAPTATEAYKWAQPVYEENGPFLWIRAYRNHVSLGFWRGTELKDPKNLLEGSGEQMRHIKLTSAKEIKPGALKQWVREAAKLNRVQGNPTMGALKKEKKQKVEREK